MIMDDSKHAKILFDLPDTSDGETLWAIVTEDGYRIDNIPFYATGIALGDVVSAERGDDGMLHFKRILIESGHSTVQLWFADEATVADVRNDLRSLGCASELDLPRLVAVDVPPSVPYSRVRAYLDEKADLRVLEFQEACLGQATREPAPD